MKMNWDRVRKVAQGSKSDSTKSEVMVRTKKDRGHNCLNLGLASHGASRSPMSQSQESNNARINMEPIFAIPLLS